MFLVDLGMTTNEAFEQIIEDRGRLKKIGINQSTIRSLRKRFYEKKLTIDKMEELLLMAGAKVKQEKLWKL